MIGPQQEVSSTDQVHPGADGTDGALSALAGPSPADVLRRIWQQRAVRFGVVAASSAAGILAGAALTFTLNHFVPSGPRASGKTPPLSWNCGPS
jgi:hypothetical protein